MAFGEAIRFHGMQRQPPFGYIHAGDQLRVTLWWSAAASLPDVYSISLQLLDPHGNIVAQQDGAPTPAFSTWQPYIFYLETRTLAIPWQPAEGTYTLQLIVYNWQTGARLIITDPSDPISKEILVLARPTVSTFAYWEIR